MYTDIAGWGLQGGDGGGEVFFSSGPNPSVAMILFDLLLATFLFLPEEYPAMSWTLFVETPCVL